MANNYNIDQRKWILKQYCKLENAEHVVKNKVYERNPHTVNELKDYISDAFAEIDGNQNLCRTVCQSVLDRCEDCCKVEGGHFEHLRD